MKKLTVILSSVLAVQVLLAIILFSVQTDSGAFKSNELLLGLKPEAFDAIVIEQKEKPGLTLKKDKNKWLLPSYFNVPVAKDKLEDFSKRLLGLKTGWPVASTDEAAERFQVNADKFERKIVFQNAGKPVKTLYLGTSPGFKKIHARMDGDKNIQIINFGEFEASVTPEDWIKADLTKIDSAQLSQIKGANFTLAKANKDWTLEGLSANQSSNSVEIRSFVDKLVGMNYAAILGTEDKPEYHLAQPALTFTFKQQAEEIVHSYGKLDGGEDYVLKASNQPYYFKINKVQFDAIKKVDQKKWVTEKASVLPAPAAGLENKSASNPKSNGK